MPTTNSALVTLELGKSLADLLADSGASMVEQYSALRIAKTLVGISGASVTASEMTSPAPARSSGDAD